MKNKRKTKIGNSLKIITFLFLVIVIITLSFNPNYILEKNSNNLSLAIVLSESMEPNLFKNDLILIKKQDTYNVNDIIVYHKENDLIVHRIIQKDDKKIITKGDNNNKEDNPIHENDICGLVKLRIPYIGCLIKFFKSKYGIITTFLFMFLLFFYSCYQEILNMKNGGNSC